MGARDIKIATEATTLGMRGDPGSGDDRRPKRRWALVPGAGGGRGTVWLLLDCSASMADGQKLLQATRGAEAFEAACSRSALQVGVLSFGHSVRCIKAPGARTRGLARRLQRLVPDGRTPMSGAIRRATRDLSRRSGERLICMLTDGMPDDRAAALSSAEVARCLGITLFAIGTEGADADFLAMLAGRRALACWYTPAELPRAMGRVGASLSSPAGAEG